MLIAGPHTEAALPLVATAMTGVVPEGFASLVAVPIEMTAPSKLVAASLRCCPPVGGDTEGSPLSLLPSALPESVTLETDLPPLSQSPDRPATVPGVLPEEIVSESKLLPPDDQALESYTADDPPVAVAQAAGALPAPVSVPTPAMPVAKAIQDGESQEFARGGEDKPATIQSPASIPKLTLPVSPISAAPAAPAAEPASETSLADLALGRPVARPQTEQALQGPAAPLHSAPAPVPTVPVPQTASLPHALPDKGIEQTASPTIAFHSPRFMEDVAVAIMRQAPGKDATEIMLLTIEPTDLGRIEVKLQFDPETGVQAVVSADQAQVLERLRGGAGELHRALAEAAGRNDLAPPRFEARSEGAASSPGGGSTGLGGGHADTSGQGQGGNTPTWHRRQSFDAFDPAMLVANPSHRPLAIAAGRVDLLA